MDRFYEPMQGPAAAVPVKRAGARSGLPAGVVDGILSSRTGQRIGAFEKRNGVWVPNGTHDISNADDSIRATADGAQVTVNTVDVLAGHGLVDGDIVTIKKKSTGLYIARGRTLSSVGAEIMTFSGTAVTFADTDELIKEGFQADHPYDANDFVAKGTPACFWDGGLVMYGGAYSIPWQPGSLGANMPKELFVMADVDILDDGSAADGDHAYYGWHNASDALAGGGIWHDTAGPRWESALAQNNVTAPTQGGGGTDLGLSDASTSDHQLTCSFYSRTATNGMRTYASVGDDHEYAVAISSGAATTFQLGTNGPATACVAIVKGDGLFLRLKGLTYRCLP